MTAQETFISYKNHSIYLQVWPVPQPKAHLLVIHGLGEHSSAYTPFCQFLNQHDISCYSTDLIGHGKSSGQRGYIPDIQTYVDQIEFVSQHIVKDFKIPQLSVFSHSLGGLIHLKKLQNDPQGFTKQHQALFSNPLLGIKVDAPEWKRQIAGTLAQFLPRLTFFNEIQPEALTKDPAMYPQYLADPLRHHRISTRLFIEMQEEIQLLSNQTPQFQIPTLLLLSPSDQVCDADCTQSFFDHAPQTQIELFPQSGHEILNDLSKERAYNLIKDFILGA